MEFSANLTSLPNTHNEECEELISVGKHEEMDTDDPDATILFR